MSVPQESDSNLPPEDAPGSRKQTLISNLPSPVSEKTAPAVPSAPLSPQKLTPEEQLALYEKELKEDDWGHQPC